MFSYFVIALVMVEGVVTAVAGVKVLNGWSDTLAVLTLATLILAAYEGGKAGW